MNTRIFRPILGEHFGQLRDLGRSTGRSRQHRAIALRDKLASYATGPAEAHSGTAGRAQLANRTRESASSPPCRAADVAEEIYQSAGMNVPRAASTVESTGSSSLRPQALTIRLTTG